MQLIFFYKYRHLYFNIEEPISLIAKVLTNFRDVTSCISVAGTQVFTDTFLYPYTSYSYHLEASNVHGSTSSSTLTYRTQPGIPIGSLHLNPILPFGPHSVSFNWTALSNNSGPIEKYILICTSFIGLQPCGQHEGLETFATIWNLVPFTRYSFYLQACTSGGCLLSQQVAVITAQAPPEEQQPPAVRSISSTGLAVEWEHPKKPNGRIWCPWFNKVTSVSCLIIWNVS